MLLIKILASWFFSQTMILVKNKLLAIVKVFKTLHYHLKDCQYKIFVFMSQNNLYHFMNEFDMFKNYLGIIFE